LHHFYIINFRDYCVERQNNPVNLIQFKAGGIENSVREAGGVT